MSRLTDRIWQCRELSIDAAKAGQRQKQTGYLAELLGLFDARDKRPCDPFQVAADYMRRYSDGYHDGTSLLLIEEPACVVPQ